MKYKRSCPLWLMVALYLTLPGSAFGYSLSMKAVSQDGVTPIGQLSRGQSFYLRILADDTAGIAGCAFTLSYPEAVITAPETSAEGTAVVESEITSVFPFSFANPIDQTTYQTHRENASAPGMMLFSAAAIDAGSGGSMQTASMDNTLFTVKFTVKSDAAEGDFFFTLSQSRLLSPALGLGIDTDSDGAKDTPEPVPVLVGALPENDPSYTNIELAYPVLLGDADHPFSEVPLKLSVALPVTYASGGGTFPPQNPAPGDNQAITAGITVPAGVAITGNTVASGVTVINKGTMHNPANNGIIAGGTLGGAIANTGTVSNVTLASGSTLDGGLLTGDVSALGDGAVVTNAIVDASSLANVTIGGGCRLTANTAESNPDLDLTAVVADADGAVSTAIPIMVDPDGNTLTLAQLIAGRINDELGDTSCSASDDDSGNTIISAETLGSLIVPAAITSVATTSEADSVSFTASGELRIVKNHISTTMAPASADEQSFAAALQTASAGFSEDSDHVVMVNLPDGARLVFRFDILALRPSTTAAIASAGAAFSLAGDVFDTGDFCLMITYPDGTTQKMPPFIHALGEIRSFAEEGGTDYRIIPGTGVIEVFESGRLVFRGRPDYMVTEPGQTELSIEIAGDVNDDGLVDIYLISPSGRQVIYSLSID